MEPVSETRVAGIVPGQAATASWSAILAGACVAAAIAVVLFALGSGLGFAMVSPWDGRGISLTTFAVTTAIWLIVIQWVSSAAGGYIAGRLRTRWIGTHPHEVFFRDSAHGLVTWSLATVLAATVLAGLFTFAVGGGVHAATAVAVSAGEQTAGAATPSYLYGMDKLFRPADGTAAAARNAQDARTEVTNVMVQAVATNSAVTDSDRAYLAELVAARTGVTADEAQRRVNDFIATAGEARDAVKAAADSARKAAAKAAIFGALALAIGAFIAAVSAVVGGRLRDEHP
jgi:hypothetical protein